MSLRLPADGGLAVGRPLGGAERLAHLGLGQAQGQPADLERFGKLADLLQVDAVHLAGRRLWVCNTTHTTHTHTKKGLICPRHLIRLYRKMKQTNRIF